MLALQLSFECSYSTGEQESLAKVHAMRTWRRYLDGRKCAEVKDHNPPVHLQTQAQLTRRYKPGVTRQADALSRLPLLMEPETSILSAMQLRPRQALPPQLMVQKAKRRQTHVQTGQAAVKESVASQSGFEGQFLFAPRPVALFSLRVCSSFMYTA